MLLGQLINTGELEGLSPEALRELLTKLDNEIVNDTSDKEPATE
jgi:hypothetical protein